MTFSDDGCRVHYFQYLFHVTLSKTNKNSTQLLRVAEVPFCKTCERSTTTELVFFVSYIGKVLTVFMTNTFGVVDSTYKDNQTMKVLGVSEIL